MADILIVDDQDRTLEMCRRAIPEHSYRGPARSWKETAESLARARGRIDLVLLDVHFAIAEQELLGWKSDMTGSQVGCDGGKDWRSCGRSESDIRNCQSY